MTRSTATPRAPSRPGSEIPVRVWQVLATPRWVGLTLAAVLAVAGCVALGYWQFTRTQDLLAAERAQASVEAPLLEVAPDPGPLDGAAIGRAVLASGVYEAVGQRLVAQRLNDGGQAGWWVLTPLRLDSGGTLAVVRGWVADGPVAGSAGAGGAEAARAGPAPETGAVTVRGRLQPSERFYGASAQRTDAALTRIDTGELTDLWGPDVRGGFLVLGSQEPAPGPGAPQFIAAPVVAGGGGGFPWQNAAYTLQWVVFAGFAVVLWFRWLFDDVRRARRGQETGPAAHVGAPG